MNIKVGIVLCTYEPVIPQFLIQLNSLKSQTHSNFICYLMDDYSSPETISEIEKLVNDDLRFVIHYGSQNIGAYQNFEKGIKMILSEDVQFIALCDQDDYWFPEKIESQVERLSYSNKSITSCDLEICLQNGETLRPRLRKGARSLNFIDLLAANDVAGSSILMTREFAKESIPFPGGFPNLYHDYWLALLGSSKKKLDLDNRILYKFVQHGRNASGDRRSNRWDSLSVSLRNYRKLSAQKNFIKERIILIEGVRIHTYQSNIVLKRGTILKRLLKRVHPGDRLIGLLLLALHSSNY